MSVHGAFDGGISAARLEILRTLPHFAARMLGRSREVTRTAARTLRSYPAAHVSERVVVQSSVSPEPPAFLITISTGVTKACASSTRGQNKSCSLRHAKIERTKNSGSSASLDGIHRFCPRTLLSYGKSDKWSPMHHARVHCRPIPRGGCPRRSKDRISAVARKFATSRQTIMRVRDKCSRVSLTATPINQLFFDAREAANSRQRGMQPTCVLLYAPTEAIQRILNGSAG